MKKQITLFAGFVFMLLTTAGCMKNESGSKNGRAVPAELDSIIGQWHRAAAGSDHKNYIGAMSADGVYIGTDATEYWTKGEFSEWSKPYFDKKRGWNLIPLQRHLYTSSDGTTAWFDELLDTGMGLCRGSGVLEKINGEWKIRHYVLSPTVPNELIQEVKNLKTLQDSLIISDIKSAN